MKLKIAIVFGPSLDRHMFQSLKGRLMIIAGAYPKATSQVS